MKVVDLKETNNEKVVEFVESAVRRCAEHRKLEDAALVISYSDGSVMTTFMRGDVSVLGGLEILKARIVEGLLQ